MLSQQPIAYPNVGQPLGGLPQAGVGQVGQYPPQVAAGAPVGVMPQQFAAQVPPAPAPAPAPVPAPVPAAAPPSQSKIADDFDEIFGFTTPSPAPAPAPAAPAVPTPAPAPVAPAAAAAFPPADLTAGYQPPPQPAAAGFGVTPQVIQPTADIAPTAGFPAPVAAPVPAATGILPTTAPTAAAGLPTGLPQAALNPAAPGGLGMMAPTPATATTTPTPATATPQPGVGVGVGLMPGGINPTAATPLPGAQFGAPLAPTPDLTAAMMGLNVGGTTPGLLPGAMGTAGLTPGLAGVGGVAVDPTLMGAAGNDELLEVERKQRDSMRAIQKIKDEIMALKGQTETASMERRARDTAAHQQSHAAAQSVQVAAHTAIQEENKRAQEREDENLARQLQAMEGAQPPRAPTTQYEGVGGVSQLEQEQRDLALAQEMQNEENKTTRTATSTRPSGGYSSTSNTSSYGRQSYGGSYGNTNTTSYEGLGGVSRLEQEQRDMALAQEMQEQENKKSQRHERHSGGGSHYGSGAHGGHDGGEVRVQSVSVCDTMTLDGVTFFVVQVSMTNGKSWKLQKRYSVFDTLHQKFSAAGYPGSNFPPKTMFKLTGQGIESRRTHLNMWLSDLVEKAKVEHRPMELRAALMDFLELEQRA